MALLLSHRRAGGRLVRQSQRHGEHNLLASHWPTHARNSARRNDDARECGTSRGSNDSGVRKKNRDEAKHKESGQNIEWISPS